VYKTTFGSFDGDSWERLCQQVFKKKFAADGYQQIPATPGDFGLEGFTALTGCGFQCYCPDAHYTKQELYKKQRDKITRDLKKLQIYQDQLERCLGSTKLKHWYFVTPEVGHNDLLAHARTKEAEVRSWGLRILQPDFQVLLHDAEHYLTEIVELLSAAGSSLDFGGLATELSPLTHPQEVYEQNVLRKTRERLKERAASDRYATVLSALNQQTLANFLEHDAHFRRIYETAPTLHAKLIRLINEYEAFVVETGATWNGTAHELTEKVRDGLQDRIVRELKPQIDETGAAQIARLMVARWLAVCELDYG
jgi:hypothetical protein